MEKVRYGIIGLGNQGSSYMYNIFDKNKIEGAVVSACCDNNPAKIEAMKAKTTIRQTPTTNARKVSLLKVLNSTMNRKKPKPCVSSRYWKSAFRALIMV